MKLRLGVVVLSLLLASACGFRLRNDVALPPEMQSTFIAYAGTDSALLRAIARALNLSDARVAASAADATAVLVMKNVSVSSRVLAKDSSGRAREYEIQVTLGYALHAPDGRVLVPAQLVQRRGNVVLNPSEPLANAGDVTRAAESLREDAVWDMLGRIAAADIPVATPAELPEPSPGAQP